MSSIGRNRVLHAPAEIITREDAPPIIQRAPALKNILFSARLSSCWLPQPEHKFLFRRPIRVQKRCSCSYFSTNCSIEVYCSTAVRAQYSTVVSQALGSGGGIIFVRTGSKREVRSVLLFAVAAVFLLYVAAVVYLMCGFLFSTPGPI